jgi:hypothetical protein
MNNAESAPVRQPTDTALADTPDSAAGLPAANRRALELAFIRGDARKSEILQQPDMLNGEALAARLGLSRATVNNRRLAGNLLALDFGTKRGVRYPAWQCELVEDREGRESFEAILQTLAPLGAWSRYRFFVQPAPALAGATPIDALRAHRVHEVAELAQTWVEGTQGGA